MPRIAIEPKEKREKKGNKKASGAVSHALQPRAYFADPQTSPGSHAGIVTELAPPLLPAVRLSWMTEFAYMIIQLHLEHCFPPRCNCPLIQFPDSLLAMLFPEQTRPQVGGFTTLSQRPLRFLKEVMMFLKVFSLNHKNHHFKHLPKPSKIIKHSNGINNKL